MTGGKPKLKKLYREVMDAAEDEARQFGGSVEIDHGGKHPLVRLSLPGSEHVIPFSGTPRVAGHSTTWIRQRIRQKVREQ